MSEWFNFALYAIQQIVTKIFTLDLGLGFSLGDLDVALLLIGIVAGALIVKSRNIHSAGVTVGERD